jgi:hypothetical protein
VENITLVERRKAVDRDPACCGKLPYKLLNGDVAFTWWEVNFGKTNPSLSFVVCLTC